jgi:NADH:ubiquinone oxidoreductase subunit E
MKLKKPNLEELYSEETQKKLEVLKILNFTNPWIPAEDIAELNNPLYMNDEEIYYVATIFGDLKTLNQKRALIDFVHIKCDDNTITRFMNIFPEDTMNQIMLNC